MLRQARNVVLKGLAACTFAVGAVEVTTKLPSEGRSSQLYHSLCDDVITPLLRFSLNPETAHNVAVESAKRGFGPRFRPSAIEQGLIHSSTSPFASSGSSSRLEFNNCVGLAAGFDKDGVAIQAMSDMGFGSVEIGSVTPEPQPGNPQPRMFRLTEDLGVINRYGFNSKGVNEVEKNLREFRFGPATPEVNETEHKSTMTTLQLVEQSLHAVISIFYKPTVKERPVAVVGVNLGKNKTSEDEIVDYQRGIRQLGPFADYLVINISSPNTPGLRDLQAAKPLKKLLLAALQARKDIPPRDRNGLPFVPPLLVKISPDLNDSQLKDTLDTIMECGIDGIVVTNTTLQRPSTIQSKHKVETGGLSGAPVRDISTECIRKVYRVTKGRIAIVGVGGVGSGKDVYEKLKAGANLVQIYSMMVYEGPGVVSRIRKELAEIMVQNGQRNVEDIVGLDHIDIYWEKREARLLEKRQTDNFILDSRQNSTGKTID